VRSVTGTKPLQVHSTFSGVGASGKPGAVQAAVRERIEAAGANLMFVPTCSLDFNPIEKAFSKLTALLRKAAERSVSESDS
jgi:transposase